MTKASDCNDYKWYALALLTLAQGCHALDRAIIGLVLDPVGREFALNDSELGLLAGFAYGLAFAAAAIPAGMLVDRVNRKNLLAGALALWSGLTALCGLANSYLTLLLGRAAVGVAESAGSPTGISLLADYFKPSQRASAIGIWYLSSALGVFGTYLVGGYVASIYGWRAAFFVAGLPGLLIAAIVFASLREPLRGASDVPTEEVGPCGLGEGLQYIWRNKQIVRVLVGITLMAIAQSATLTWMTSFLIRAHDYDLVGAGVVTAVTMGVLAPSGGFVLGIAIDAMNRRKGYSLARISLACTYTTAVSALFGMVAVSAPGGIAMLVMLGSYTFFQAAHNGAANSILVGLSGVHVRGFVLATLQVLTNLLGWGLGPVIVGSVSDSVGGEFGLQWGMATVICFHFLAAYQFVRLWRSKRVGQRPPVAAEPLEIGE